MLQNHQQGDTDEPVKNTVICANMIMFDHQDDTEQSS